jgi:hypothetical protein
MAPVMKASKPQQMLFVDVQKSNEKDVKTKIRSHLMNEHVRQKRIQQERYLKSAVQFPKRRALETHYQRDGDVAGSRFIRTGTSTVSSHRSHRRSSEDTALQEELARYLDHDTQSSGGDDLLPSPLTAVSSLRRDSFSSYPLPLDSDSHQLVDLWMVHFSQMTQLNLSPGIESIYHPTLNVFFPLAMSSPAAFETTVLHFAALHRAKLRGANTQTDRHVMYHRTKALQLTQDRVHRAIHRGEKTTDGDIVAALSLGTAECRLGDQVAACIHLQGARQLIRRRREQSQLPNNHRLDLLFNWYNINTEISSHYEARTNPRVFVELATDFDNFIATLDNFHALALSHHQLGIKAAAPRLASPHRLDPALCRILIGPSPSSPTYSQFSFQMSRFLVLLHIHMALLFFQDDITKAENWLKQLSLRIIDVDMEFRPNPVFLLTWTLLSDSTLHHSLRGWVVNRVSVLFKLLSVRTRHRVTDFLHALLVLEEDENGVLIIPEIDKTQLENEVIKFGVEELTERLLML